jgi:hypothetical protein
VKDEGKLTSGFEGRLCAVWTCRAPLKTYGAYLHTDRDDGKLVMFCPACHEQVRLHWSLRFPVVVL